MRPAALLAAAALAGPLAPAAGAQSTASPATARLLQGDYAVPDAPALRLLDLDESTLLRPATTRALAAQLASASGDLSFLPRAFGVEFSPGLLVDGERLTIDAYVRRKLWYRTRLSVAARRGEGAAARSQVAAAVRLGLQDASDLRTNANFTRAILALTDWKRDSLRLVETTRLALGVPVTDAPTPAQQQQVDREVGQQLGNRAAQTRELVAAVKRAREDALWNADVFDLALGVRSSSADSTGGRARFDGVSGWLTKGWGFAPRAQLLVGGRGAYERDPSADTIGAGLRGVGDATARLYVGGNRYKVLAELQATGRASAAPRWLGNVGGELQLAPILWASVSAGWRAAGALDRGRVVSAVTFKFNPSGV